MRASIEPGARTRARGGRHDSPPKLTHITYRLEVTTDEPAHRVDLLHRNITRHGTVFNTLAPVCEIAGEIVAVPMIAT